MVRLKTLGPSFQSSPLGNTLKSYAILDHNLKTTKGQNAQA